MVKPFDRIELRARAHDHAAESLPPPGQRALQIRLIDTRAAPARMVIADDHELARAGLLLSAKQEGG